MPQNLQLYTHPRLVTKLVNFLGAAFIPAAMAWYSVVSSVRSGKGMESTSLIRGLSGVEMMFPLFLKVIPETSFRLSSFSRVFVSCRAVCSPSPLTITSIHGYFLRILLGLYVAWRPPRTVVMLGLAFLACLAIWGAVRLVHVSVDKPSMSGSSFLIQLVVWVVVRFFAVASRRETSMPWFFR